MTSKENRQAQAKKAPRARARKDGRGRPEIFAHPDLVKGFAEPRVSAPDPSTNTAQPPGASDRSRPAALVVDEVHDFSQVPLNVSDLQHFVRQGRSG